MYREMTVQEFADWCNRVANGLAGVARASMREAIDLTIQDATEWSSGPYSRADQEAMYRIGVGGKLRGPYSRVDPHPPTTPAVINTWEGNLKAGWHGEPIRRTPDGNYLSSVGNVVEHAKFMYEERTPPLWQPLGPGEFVPPDDPTRGTRKMMARPLPLRVVEYVEPKFFDDYQPRVVKLFES